MDEEITHVLWQRGAGGSKKGRPTGFSAPFRGVLSSSARAIEQRNRAALRDHESKTIEAAKAADRAAKTQLKKKLEKQPEYITLSKASKTQYFTERHEELEQKRFEEKKSSKLSQFLITHIDLQ